MKPYRVLSLDGGGIRGLFTASVLHGVTQRIARMNGHPENALDVGGAFDLIAGTSTGAILAAGLAAGVPLERIIALYRDKAASIFSDPVPKRKGLLWWAMRHRKSPANSPEQLREALQGVFGGETVGQVYGRRGVALCVPTVDAVSQRAWVYKTPHDERGGRLHRDDDYSLVDVCMSSAAAPIVFPVHGVAKPRDPNKTSNWFVDGGLWANNPVVVAIIEALEFAPPDAPIQVISVSTCPPFRGDSIDSASCKRGLQDWRAGIRVLEVALDAQSGAYDYMAKTLASQLSGRVTYVRLTDPQQSPDEADQLHLDNPDSVDVLARLSNRAVDLNISEATTGEKRKALLTEIFANLKRLP